MITTAFYYSTKLSEELFIRDNRFYPGKAFETFPVWYEYLQKNYPDEQIYIIHDISSLPIEEYIPNIIDNYEFLKEDQYTFDKSKKVHIKKVQSSKRKECWWPIQRTLCEAIKFSYLNKQDLFWIDNDLFLNTDIRPLYKGYDVFAPNINHYQFTMDSILFYLSSKKLHELDKVLYLPDYLKNILENGGFNLRQHTFHEGGLYKLFCYGNTNSSLNIEATHLSCYNNFMKFLNRNPLDSDNYKRLISLLNNIDFEKLKGVELEFLDLLCQK